MKISFFKIELLSLKIILIFQKNNLFFRNDLIKITLIKFLKFN